MASITLRKTKDGQQSYRALVRMKGHAAQSATFSRKTDAKRWGEETEAAIRDGRYFKTREAQRRVFSELVTKYLDEVIPELSEGQKLEQPRHLAWWREQLGPRTLADITPPVINDQTAKLKKIPSRKGGTLAPATVKKYLSTLSSALNAAIDWGWIETNPAHTAKKPKVDNARTRYLSNEERDRLLVACKKSSNRFLYPAVVIALSTGARRGEILNLKWHDIDFERGCATLWKTKNGETRVLPLVGHVMDVLKALRKTRRVDTDLVFPSNGGRQYKAHGTERPLDITQPFYRALNVAEVSDFRFHDLRHSAASYLAMNKATPSEIAAVLGHKTLAMVKRYAHLSEQHTAHIVADMNSKIFAEVK
jgi:integrase